MRKLIFVLAGLLVPAMLMAGLDQVWVSQYNGPGNDGRASDVVVDASGNVYVTGTSLGSGTNYDYATIKYNADGTQQWVARYDGPGSGYDSACAIAVDASGNAYVTGGSSGSDGYLHYATVKYDANGNQKWVARYDNGCNFDHACAIALDVSGNAYVTGRSVNSSGKDDYATIKYDANGNQQWVTRYDNGNYDWACAIAVDASGNAYVTGFSNTSDGMNADYATVKYDANGNPQWVARYDNGISDFARAIAVDASGNAYVTGTSDNQHSSGCATVKYNSSGVQQWVARYDPVVGAEAFAIAVDASGNACITGRDYVWHPAYNPDYLTVKYDADGNQQWVAWYDNGFEDGACAVAVDVAGNAYVTGYSAGASGIKGYATVKYGLSGNQLWVVRHDGDGSDQASAIAVDASGNAYVTGYSGTGNGVFSFLTLRYDADGAQIWLARFGGSGLQNANEFYKVACDASGNVYVTGYSNDPSTGYDYATVKYDASGNQQWVARYDNGGDDSACAIALDASGNAYVTGLSWNSAGNYDYATVKYDANGNKQWVARYDNGGDDKAVAIAVDVSGNAYVTGYSYSWPDTDYATVKYDASGNQQWVARYNNGGKDYAQAIALDGSGNTYVTGSSHSSSWNYDYATVKYDANGVQQWVARYDYDEDDRASAIAIDASGDVYVTGASHNARTLHVHEYATVKYDASGNQQWVARYNDGSQDYAFDIAVDASDNAYVTGHSWGADRDYLTVKYDASGTRKWVARYDNGGDDKACAIAVDASGNAYVTGRSSTPQNGDNCTTIAYGPDGSELAEASYNGTGNGDDFGDDIAIDASGNVLVAGQASAAASYCYGLVIKYRPPNPVLPRPDVGVASIDEPSGVVDTLRETPKAVVRNFGTVTASFDVWFEIRDSATNTVRYLEKVAVTELDGGSDYSAVFPDWDVPNDHEGRYYSCSWTALSGDIDVHNDTARSQFAVEAKQQGPPAWTPWPEVPAGEKNREVKQGAAAATDPLGLYVYLLKGSNTCEFYRYDPATGSWLALDPIPERGRDNKKRDVDEGGTLAQVNGKFYATKGGKCLEFWEYDPAGAQGYRWTQKADVPAGTKDVQSGAGAAGVQIGPSSFVYLLKASETFEFYRYDVAQNSWEARANAPGDKKKKWGEGSCVSSDGVDTVYALKGGENEFYAYVVSTNTWLARPDLPLGPKKKQAKGGAAICCHLRNVYCLKGGNTQEFWVYNCDGNTWTQGSDVPLGPHKSRVQDGGTLVYCRASRFLFATKGNCLEFWSYGRLSNYSGAMSDQEPIELSGRLTPYRLDVRPTVVTGQASVAYALPQAGNVVLALYDAGGRLVKTLVHGTSRPGVYTAQLAVSDLARGVYILRYRSGEYKAARKLVVE